MLDNKSNNRRALRTMAMGAALLGAGMAFASEPKAPKPESRALIMAISDYPRDPLPGNRDDVVSAKKIAERIGVAAGNVVVADDSQLTAQGMRSVLGKFAASVNPGDAVFIYYSGHGTQAAGSDGKCRSGLVSFDLDMVESDDIYRTLETIAAKASRVTMMNDSCFSGGVVTKALGAIPTKSTMTKGGTACGKADNTAKSFTKGISKSPSGRYSYLAASKDTEVAFPAYKGQPDDPHGKKGSVATNAWLDCIQDSATDTNGSGSVDVAELQGCAQQRIDKWKYNQHVASAGDTAMLVVPGAASPAAELVKPTAAHGVAALRDLVHQRDDSKPVKLTTKKPRLKIGDNVEFEVTTQHGGYLTILQVGTQGEYYVLYPNTHDGRKGTNYVGPGTHTLPRASWKIQAGGPAGKNTVLALLHEKETDLSKAIRNQEGAFSSAATGADTRSLIAAANCVSKTLKVVGTECGGGFGASDPLEIVEY